MGTIRTTISIPKDIHQKLKREALEKGQSFNQVLLQKIMAREASNLQKSLEKIDRLAKKVNTKNINYKELINYGREY